MLKKNPENVQEDFRGMFEKILVNTQEEWTIYNAIKPKQN